MCLSALLSKRAPRSSQPPTPAGSLLCTTPAAYKIDQIRLDEVRSHYHRLRAGFEARLHEQQGSETLWRTRLWVREVLRVLLRFNAAVAPPALPLPVPSRPVGPAALQPAGFGDLALDSHVSKLCLVLEGCVSAVRALPFVCVHSEARRRRHARALMPHHRLFRRPVIACAHCRTRTAAFTPLLSPPRCRFNSPHRTHPHQAVYAAGPAAVAYRADDRSRGRHTVSHR
jgi:hypothetical protein